MSYQDSLIVAMAWEFTAPLHTGQRLSHSYINLASAYQLEYGAMLGEV